MHYYNGIDAAKRIGINYKTLLRWIERGKVRPEEGKTPTGQLVISGDQVEAARREVQRERSLFAEDEIAIDINGQAQTEADMPEAQYAKLLNLWQETRTVMDNLALLQENLKFEVTTQLSKFVTILKEQDERIEKLTARVATLESQLQGLQTAGPKKRVPPKPDEEAPEGFTYLSDFCTQHYVPYQAGADLFPRAIHGQHITVQRRKHAVIGPRGKHDFYVQLHTRDDFRACDDCPHEEL